MRKMRRLIVSVTSTVMAMALLVMGVYVYAATQRTTNITGQITFRAENVSANIFVYNSLRQNANYIAPYIAEDPDISRATVNTGAIPDIQYLVTDQNQATARTIDINSNNLELNNDNLTYTYYVLIKNTFAEGGDAILLSYTAPTAGTEYSVSVSNEYSPYYTAYANVTVESVEYIYIQPQAEFVVSISLTIEPENAGSELTLNLGSTFNLTRYDGESTERATSGLSYTLINSDTEYEVDGYNQPEGTTIDKLYIPRTHLEKPVTSIGAGAFDSCYIEYVYLPSTITNIEDEAFGDSSLTSVTIPSSVTNIGDAAFVNVPLTSVVIPSSVTSIGNYAFTSNSLTSVVIPSSVTSIGYSAFSGNSNLTSIIVDSENANYEVLTSGFLVTKPTETQTVIAYAQGLGSDITIPSSVTSIGVEAFAYNSLTSVIIPSSVTSIGNKAFSNNLLKSVTIPDSVTNIGDWAFSNNSLISVTFEPDSQLTSIGNFAFAYNSNLADITMLSAQPPTLGTLALGNFSSLKIWVPSAYYSVYYGSGNTVTGWDQAPSYRGLVDRIV